MIEDYFPTTSDRMARAERYHEDRFMHTDKTQEEMTLEYLEWYGSITDLEALTAFNCRRLAARIHDLRVKGYPIETSLSRGRKNYAIYRLREE